MFDSLPSHHDDHYGGVDGHTAHRFGLRRWRRFQASAGTRGGRGPCFLAGGDAVSDARFLHLYGPLPDVGREPFRETEPETEHGSRRRTLTGRLTPTKFRRYVLFHSFSPLLLAFRTVFFSGVGY